MNTISVEKSAFVKALTIGGGYACGNKNLPILDCVKIKVRNGSINIVSSNAENAISYRMDSVESDFEGSFCVGYKSALQYVKLVSGSKVDLMLDDDLKTLKIKHSKGSISLPLYDSSEFPNIDIDKESVSVELDSSLLSNWLYEASSFTKDDDLRPIFGCVLLYQRGKELGCVATDGMKMFYDQMEREGEPFELLISQGALKGICNVAKSCSKVNLSIGSKSVSAKGDGISVVSRIMEGRFPNHMSVIPPTSSIKVIADRKDLMESINRCAVGGSMLTSLVKMSISGMSMFLVAEDIDFSIKAKESIMVNSNGDITIGVKADHLLKILNAISTDEIIMDMQDPSRSILFHECEQKNVKSKKIMLLMPMSLN